MMPEINEDTCLELGQADENEVELSVNKIRGGNLEIIIIKGFTYLLQVYLFCIGNLGRPHEECEIFFVEETT